MPARRFRHLAEAAGVYLLWGCFRILPLETASWVAGRIARLIGPLLSVHRVAETNLRRAMPELGDRQVRDILDRMWDNLGRVAGECPHLPRLHVWRDRIDLEGREWFDALAASGEPVLFLSGHFANWEMAPMLSALQGVPLTLVYRPANNPYVERLIRRMRAPYNAGLHPKGPGAALSLFRTFRKGGHAAMLVDQKLNTGIAVPFFGRDAMTTPAPAEIGLKLGLPLVPVRIRRTRGARFAATFHAPLRVSAELPSEDAVRDTTLAVNRILETWVRDDPAQWFWVHRRWPKDA